MFKHYSTKEKIKTIINYLFYIGFIILYISLFRKSSKEIGDYFWMLFGVIALIGAIYTEYLKYLYNKSLYTLNFKLAPKSAMDFYDYLVKYDYLKIYEKNRGLFDVSAYLELNQPEKVLEIIENNKQKFSSSLELLLISTYYQMRAYLLMNKKKEINELYSTVIKDIYSLKEKKQPKIFQKKEFEAMSELAKNNKSRALECFENVNMKHYNPKEKSFVYKYLIELSSAEKKEKYQQEYNELLEAVKNESK